MKVLRLALAAALGILFASAAAAQTRVLVRGTISKIDDKTVTVATREGTTDTVKLGDKWSVSMVEPIAMSAIKPGAFVGIASLGTRRSRF